jgi:hypothetical protein
MLLSPPTYRRKDHSMPRSALKTSTVSVPSRKSNARAVTKKTRAMKTQTERKKPSLAERRRKSAEVWGAVYQAMDREVGVTDNS